MQKSSERGNVLWFILIAVVLLGALTMVLSRSGSSVNQNGNTEQMSIQASQIIRYAKSVETSIEQMTLRNVSENEISFANPKTLTNYTNASCDDDSDATYPGCLVFNKEGGGLAYQGFNNQDWIFTGADNVGTTNGPIGTTAIKTGNDLIMLLPITNKALCMQINRQAGIDNPSNAPPVDTTGIAYTPFTGSYAAGGPTILDGDPTPFELDTHAVGCFTDAVTSNAMYFYSVILVR